MRTTRPLAITALALGIGAAPAACSHPRPAESANPGAVNQAAGVRSIEGAQATAQTEFGLLAGGDYAGAWELWTDAAKHAVGRPGFVAHAAACRPGLGVAARVVSVRPVDDNDVDVAWQRGTQTGTARLIYAGGAWRFQPDPATLAGYAAATCPSAS
jgi:hypothetical protein